MSDFDDLVSAVAGLQRDLAKLRTDYDNTFVQGAVTDRDHEKGVRIALDKDGKNKSDWTRPADNTGASRVLPRLKDQVLIVNPHGDPRQGVAIGLGHSKERKNPAKDADNTVLLERDGVRIESDGRGGVLITAKRILLKAEGVSGELTGEGLKVTGGKVEHDGKNIGKDHKHTDVQKGGGESGPPAA